MANDGEESSSNVVFSLKNSGIYIILICEKVALNPQLHRICLNFVFIVIS